LLIVLVVVLIVFSVFSTIVEYCCDGSRSRVDLSQVVPEPQCVEPDQASVVDAPLTTGSSMLGVVVGGGLSDDP
jgi:hypothetical protein